MKPIRTRHEVTTVQTTVTTEIKWQQFKLPNLLEYELYSKWKCSNIYLVNFIFSIVKGVNSLYLSAVSLQMISKKVTCQKGCWERTKPCSQKERIWFSAWICCSLVAMGLVKKSVGCSRHSWPWVRGGCSDDCFHQPCSLTSVRIRIYKNAILYNSCMV